MSRFEQDNCAPLRGEIRELRNAINTIQHGHDQLLSQFKELIDREVAFRSDWTRSMTEIAVKFEHVVGKLSGLVDWQEHVQEWRDSTDERLSKNNEWRAYITGVLSIVSVLTLAVVAPVMVAWVRHHMGTP